MSHIADRVWHIVESVCHTVLKISFSILGIKLTEEKTRAFMQFVKFGIVGLSNTIISYVLYLISLKLFQSWMLFQQTDYVIAQIIGFVLSVLWSFYWNNKLVFTIEEGHTRSLWKTLLKTYASYSFTGLFLNSILIIFWVQVCHISEYFAPIINLLISVPLNFLINKLWAFKSD